ncbi:MAG TPA: NUDIX hydrolase [Phototrophicaceae bacterium]|nr:NUDIX hydrolase [Phototrophicaceae bacterium]
MSQPRTAHFCPMCGTHLEWRERTGALRPVCPKCDHTVYFDPKVAVVVLVIQAERVLLVQRANDPKKGYWTLPGGFVEAGEDPRAAACREAVEETCLAVAVDRLLGVYYTANDGGLADMVIAYAASVTGGNLTAADDAEAAGWFSRDHIPPLAFLPTEQIVREWAAQSG